MSVTVFRAADFAGDFARLTPGLYAGNDLIGCARGSTACQPFDREIGSLRIDRNTVAILSGSSVMRSPTRVVFGPADLPTLAPIDMVGRVAAIMVLPYREYDSAIPAPIGGASIYDAPSFFGRRADLARGDYDAARLRSTEVGMLAENIGSLSVEAHCVLVLYAGSPADPTADAAVVVGPGTVEDLDLLGMAGRVTALRLIYTDPFDTPGRPRLGLGVARDYTPGAGRNPWGPAGPTAHSPGPRGAIGDVGRPVIGAWGQPPPMTAGAGSAGAIDSMAAAVEAEFAEKERRARRAEPAEPESQSTIWLWFGLILLLVIIGLYFRRQAEILGGGSRGFPETAKGRSALAALSGF